MKIKRRRKTGCVSEEKRNKGVKWKKKRRRGGHKQSEDEEKQKEKGKK